MSKYTAYMTDCPETVSIYASVSYGFISFGLAPFLLSFFGFGFDMDLNLQIALQLIYYVINFLVSVFLFFPYLKESFFWVTSETGKFIKNVCISAAFILGFGIVTTIAGILINSPIVAFSALPTAEVTLFAIPSAVIEVQPILGTLCMVLLTPFSTSLLYYATGFARTCGDSPVRAYFQIPLITAVPHIVNALTFWVWSEELILFLLHLPIHLIACRVYQKTDTIWAPIVTHMIANLITCVLFFAISL